MQNVIEKLRNLLADNLSTNGYDVFEYTITKSFKLTESNVEGDTIEIHLQATGDPTLTYTFDDVTNKVAIIDSLVSGDVIIVTYSYFSKYSETELTGWINAAFVYLSTEKYEDYTVVSGDTISPEPTLAEQNLIALIASILIKPNISGYRTPEITITFNDKMSREDKISRVINQFSKSAGVFNYLSIDLNYLDIVELDE